MKPIYFFFFFLILSSICSGTVLFNSSFTNPLEIQLQPPLNGYIYSQNQTINQTPVSFRSNDGHNFYCWYIYSSGGACNPEPSRGYFRNTIDGNNRLIVDFGCIAGNDYFCFTDFNNTISFNNSGYIEITYNWTTTNLHIEDGYGFIFGEEYNSSFLHYVSLSNVSLPINFHLSPYSQYSKTNTILNRKNSENDIHTERIYFRDTNLSTANIKFWGFGYKETYATSNNFIWSIYNITIVSNYNNPNNTFPKVNIPNLQSVYCYNNTFQHLVITPNITDVDGDTISWYHYFDQDPLQKIVIDDFSKTDYSMMANGWDFNATGCNYSTTDGYLKLYNGCNGIGIIKRLYNGTFNPPLQFYVETSMFTNTSNEYCILNWQNEKVTCLQLSTINPTNTPGGKLTDFYYWNGSGYSWFYQSSYNAQDFGLQFDINTTNDKFCIWGNSNDVCEYEYSTQLYGTTTNQSGKFYMAPTYNFIWENYEPSYIKLDNIELTPKGNIPWRTYTVGDTLTYDYSESGTKELTILATDNVHTPDYKTFGFPVTVYGDCALPQYNQSNNTLANVPTMDYINAINDGPSKFNTVFYILLFGVFLFIVFQSQSLELSLIVTGLCGLAASWIISKDLVQMISSGSLIAVGIAVLIAKVF